MTALTRALSEAQRLLGGREGRGRWLSLAVYAALAGIVGAGVQPPSLGLLQPVWENPDTHAQLLEALRRRQETLAVLGAALLACAAGARCFAFVFIRQALGAAGEGARVVREGLAHFAWSTALTLPLYALLFWAEGRVAGDAWRRLPGAPDDQTASITLTALLRFLLVLGPWVVLTLPLMAWMYEITPAVMVVRQVGPVSAAAAALRLLRRRGGACRGYFGVRLVMQVIGAALAGVALLPGIVLSAAAGAPLLALGWTAVRALGGMGTPAGVTAACTAGVLWLLILYCLMCAALVPLSALLFLFAREFLFPGREDVPTGACGSPDLPL